MANNYTILDAPVPFKEIVEANKNLTESAPQVFDGLIDALPVKSFGPRQVRLYRGFWFPEFLLRSALTMQKDFQFRPTDLFLISYPKSGTTWLKSIIFAIMTRISYPFDQHPLLTNNPHQCVPTVEMQIAAGRSSLLGAIPSPRILSTHLPYSILPESVTSSNCRIIYVCRDPKDVLVSQYHFVHESLNMGDQKGPFNEIFDMFCDGVSSYGPVWDHVLGYSKESMIRPQKILFLKYEEMVKDTIKCVKRIAEFIECPFTEAEEKSGVVEQIVELCSFQKQKDLKVNKTIIESKIETQIPYSAYFRKGSIGDWRNHMTLEMAQKLDALADEKFKGLDILKVTVGSNSI
ncbi:hypothetical protein LUZ60_003033 [Juncus effusus]|nr:hypothetical protein LUZ60_003033 [Juncus effusus]